jgi:gluconokinase
LERNGAEMKNAASGGSTPCGAQLAGMTGSMEGFFMKPRSTEDETHGLRYFPRMLDKIRLQAKGQLDPEYHENLGRGADRRLIKFLRVEYDKLCARVGAGGTDEEILDWCFANGHRLYKNDIEIWNGFISKLGWNDFASGHLAKSKAAAGLADRDDIQTLGHLFDVEEGRKP